MHDDNGVGGGKVRMLFEHWPECFSLKGRVQQSPLMIFAQKEVDRLIAKSAKPIKKHSGRLEAGSAPLMDRVCNVAFHPLNNGPMNLRAMVFAIITLTLVGCSSTGAYRWVPFIGRGKKGQASATKVTQGGAFGPISAPVYYGLEFRFRLLPDTFKLSEVRSIETDLQLINRTKKTVNLQFADSRKVDFVLRDATGKKLAQWSDDQPVTQNPGYIIVNPGERAEFVGNLSTRDMVAGRTYTVEAFVVGYDKMRQSITLTPR
jgi:Intracellular proteinase inhibitor